MKRLFILFCGISVFYLTGCSNDESDNTTSNQSSAKIVTYEPSFLNYTKKRIQYYDVNNAIIADTIFNNSGVWTRRVVRTQNGNIKTTQTFNSQNTLIHTETEKYDSSGRLINTLGDYTAVFIYNSDNTITATSPINNVAYFIFSKNSEGLINNRLEISDNSTVGLNFQNQLPTEYLTGGNVIGNFTYYPNTMPANLLKNTTQMNNAILRAYRLEHLPSNSNSYLNNWLGLYRYEREFNAQNYQTHSKSISIDPNVVPNTETINSESFYFYN